MKIEILGTGCSKCKQLEANVRLAVENSGKSAEIIKITDIAEIMEFGVMSLPAIVIDDDVKCYGRLVDAKEISKWL